LSRSLAHGLQALPEEGPWDKPDLSRPTPIPPPAERGAPPAPAPERLVVLAPVPPQLKHPPHPARSGDAQQSMPRLNTPLRSKRFDAHGGDQESSFRGRGCPPRSYSASAHEKSDRPGRPLSFMIFIIFLPVTDSGSGAGERGIRARARGHTDAAGGAVAATPHHARGPLARGARRAGGADLPARGARAPAAAQRDSTHVAKVKQGTAARADGAPRRAAGRRDARGVHELGGAARGRALRDLFRRLEPRAPAHRGEQRGCLQDRHSAAAAPPRARWKVSGIGGGGSSSSSRRWVAAAEGSPWPPFTPGRSSTLLCV